MVHGYIWKIWRAAFLTWTSNSFECAREKIVPFWHHAERRSRVLLLHWEWHVIQLVCILIPVLHPMETCQLILLVGTSLTLFTGTTVRSEGKLQQHVQNFFLCSCCEMLEHEVEARQTRVRVRVFLDTVGADLGVFCTFQAHLHWATTEYCVELQTIKLWRRLRSEAVGVGLRGLDQCTLLLIHSEIESRLATVIRRSGQGFASDGKVSEAWRHSIYHLWLLQLNLTTGGTWIGGMRAARETGKFPTYVLTRPSLPAVYTVLKASACPPSGQEP